jgi:hypothetical protein
METFRLVTEAQAIIRRSFPLADPTILKPSNANPLVQGEWLGLNTSYKMARGAGAQSIPTRPNWAEKGRYDTQVIGKVPILWLGDFEADTLIFGANITALHQPLYVTDVTYNSLTKQGLDYLAVTTTEILVGYVTRLPANNGGWLRFRTA